MAQNLRDRGFSSSMDGYQQKRTHSRQKTVAPGEANVSKGRKVTNTSAQNSAVLRLPSPEQIRSAPTPVPEYGPIGLPPSEISYSPTTPIGLHYSDPRDWVAHYQNVEIPYRMNSNKQNPAADMPTDEIKRRIKELEEALNGAYADQRIARAARRATLATTSMDNAGIPTTPAQKVANYNWDVSEFLDDWMPDVTDDPVANYLAQMNHAKDAATGLAVENQSYPQNKAVFDSYDAENARNDLGVQKKEALIDKLFFEYNDLKNEYNARLAQYLQGLR